MVSCSSRWTQIHCVAEDDLDLLDLLLHSQVLGLQACAILISLSAYWKTDTSAHKMWLMLTNSHWWTSEMKKQDYLKEVKEVIIKTYLRSWLYYHKIKVYGSMILISYMKEAEKKKNVIHTISNFYQATQNPWSTELHKTGTMVKMSKDVSWNPILCLD